MRTFTVRRLFAAGVAFAVAFTVFTLVPMATASADPNGNDWYRTRVCEASNNYQVIDPSGTHFGAYQFDQGTWNSVGGQGRPDLNTPAEQDYRALYLYRMRGWQPWQCADGWHLGLRDDADARSGRVPSYAESAYMGGGGQPGPGPNPNPAPVVVPPPPLWEIPPAGSGVLFDPPLPFVSFGPGACSPVLEWWQVQMNTYGYGLATNGCNTVASRTAAHQVQYANGIQRTDTIGPLTLIAGFLGRPPR